MSCDNGSSLIVERCSVILLVFSPLAVPAEGCVMQGNARSYVMFLFFTRPVMRFLCITLSTSHIEVGGD